MAKEQVSANLSADLENMVGNSGSLGSQRFKISSDKHHKYKIIPYKQVDSTPFLENRFAILQSTNPSDTEFMVNQANKPDTMEIAKRPPLSPSCLSSQSRYFTNSLSTHDQHSVLTVSDKQSTHVVDQEEILPDQVLAHTTMDLTNGSKNIPLHILHNKHNQPDYVSCISQNRHKFGFVPLSPLRIYTGDPTYYESIPDIIKLHHQVRSSSNPNYLKCRIPLQTHFNIKNWRKYLSQYWDKQLPDLLEYGFPLDFD